MDTLWKIYEEEMPAFLTEGMRCPSVERLREIGMNCGCQYTSFPLFQKALPYSRWDHSVGTALIAWHFSRDPGAALAGLTHDIAAPVFAHVIDFVRGDYLRQESTEAGTVRLIRQDRRLTDCLARAGIGPSRAEDRLYPLVNNETPRLCADRLEYTLGNLFHFRFCAPGEIAALYRALTVAEAEDGQPELAFKDVESAGQFARLALRCAAVYVSDEDRYAMQILSELVKEALARNVLMEEDLWTTEPRIIAALGRDEALRQEWAGYTALSRTERADTPDGRPGWRRVDAKKRWIDPLVAGAGRLSRLDGAFAEEAQAFLARPLTGWITGS